MESTKKRQIALAATKFVISSSVSFTVAALVKSNLHVSPTLLNQTRVVIGAYVVGAMASDKAEDWIVVKIDETAELIRRVKEETAEDTTTE